MPEPNPGYERFKADFVATSPAVRRIRETLRPVDAAESVVASYTDAVYELRHILKDNDPGGQRRAFKTFIMFGMRSNSLSRVAPPFVSAAFIEEFWAPYMRYTADATLFKAGMMMMGNAHDVLPESARLTVLRVLGEQAAAMCLDFDDRAVLAQLLYLHIQGPDRVPIPERKGHLARWMVQGGLVTPAVRVLARPLPGGLTPAQIRDFDHAAIDFFFLLALAVASALSGEISAADAKPLLSEVQAAVLAHSPWIWTSLCRFGGGRALDHSDDGFLGIPAILYAMLAALSPATYAAAEAAGGAALLRGACQQFAAGMGNPRALRDHVSVMAEAYHTAAEGPAALRPLVCEALFPQLVAGYNSIVTACERRGLELDERMAKAQTCAGCQRKRDKTKLCSGCNTARYCSRECQARHWSAHKAACKAAQARRQRE